MAIGSVLSAGLQGIRAGIDRSDRASEQIAGFGSILENGDAAASMIELKVSEIQVKASASVVRTANQLLGTLVDIKA